MKDALKLTLATKLPKAKVAKGIKKLVAKPKAENNGLIVFIDETGEILAAQAKGLSAYAERIEQLKEATRFKGKVGDCVADFALAADAKQTPMQLVLVGAGKKDKFTATNLQKIADTLYKNINKRMQQATIALADAFTEEQLTQFGLALLNASYRFDKYKSDATEPQLEELVLISDTIQQPHIDYIDAVFSGQSLTRDVANEPGNVCFPKYMAQQALDLAKAYSDVLKVTVLDEKKMAQLGMECFLAVSRGSTQEGQMVIIEYRGKSDFSIALTPSGAGLAANIKDAVTNKLPIPKKGKKSVESSIDTTINSTENADAPIVLVGKGVTFDSGGISIKPGAGMDEMKFDMGGSASVLGTMKALCQARLPINVVGVLACAENMPAGNATRPGDVVRAMNGKSVEILNTDAEGRLVLADALCYVQRYQPKTIIDVATLTGACVIALGHVRSAVYANDEDVLFELENASTQSGDLIWHMPMDEAYHSQLESPIADLQNIGGRPAGSVTAACFLSNFVEEGQAWAHLDIAGTAWKSGKEKGATGRPVPLFMQYLKNAANSNIHSNQEHSKQEQNTANNDDSDEDKTIAE